MTALAQAPANSPHRAIVRALVVGVLFIGLAKIVGLAKELAMAWRFGSGPVADAYALTFGLVSWPAAVWASVAVALIVPIMAAAPRDGSISFDRLRGELVGFALLVGIGLGLAAFAIISIMLAQNWLGISGDRAAEVSQMLAPLSLTVPLSAISSVLAAWLISSRRQVNSLFEAVPSLALLAALIALPPTGSIVAWAVAAGFALQVLLLASVQGRDAAGTRPRFGFASPQWTQLWNGLGILVLSQALVSVSGVIDQLFVAGLGPTSNATLGYAGRLLALAQSLVSLAVVRALLPVLSSPDFGDERARWSIARRWSALLLVGGAAIAAAGWILAPWAVGLLFQRGQFGAEDTLRVSQALQFGLPQIPFFCASIVLAQYVTARRLYGLFLWGNGLSLIIKLAANLVLIPRLGIPGAMLATAVMYAGSLVFLFVAGRPRAGTSEGATQ